MSLPSGRLTLFLLTALAAACGGHRDVARPPVYAPPLAQGEATGPVVAPIYVHLAAESGSILQRSGVSGAEWVDVCASPCNGYIPAFGSYRVAVPRRDPTSPFTLPGGPGTSIAVKVDDDGHVWTTDSPGLAAHRAQSDADAAGMLFVVTRPLGR
jgi:hypothetical protein